MSYKSIERMSLSQLIELKESLERGKHINSKTYCDVNDLINEREKAKILGFVEPDLIGAV